MLFLSDPVLCFAPQAVTFEDWVEATFIICFLMSCFMGYVTTVQFNLFNYGQVFLTQSSRFINTQLLFFSGLC